MSVESRGSLPLGTHRPQSRPGDGTELPARATRPRPAELRFDQIFHAYAPYVLGLLRRLGVGEADVEDVAQEVFTAVHQRLPEFEGRSTLKTWICGIALRRAADYRRKAHRRRETVTAELEQPAEAGQLSRVQSTQEVELLRAGLAGLGDKLRDVFVLYEVEELPMADVARILGCNLFTGYTRLRTARRRIREHFEQAGYRRGDA